MEEMFEDLELNYCEQVAADAMILYLQKFGGPEAGDLIRLSVDLNQVWNEEGRKPVNLKSVIHVVNLADFINQSMEYLVEKLEECWIAVAPESVEMKTEVLSRFSTITGELVVHSMSSDFAEFVVRCGTWACLML